MLRYIFDKRYIWVYRNKIMNKNLVMTCKNTKNNMFIIAMLAKYN